MRAVLAARLEKFCRFWAFRAKFSSLPGVPLEQIEMEEDLVKEVDNGNIIVLENGHTFRHVHSFNKLL